jgi:NAD(P)H-dependent FMN reductase
MSHFAIISGSVRTGRESHRVALFFQKLITEHKLGTAEILDLKTYDFPLFEERLHMQETKDAKAVEFAQKIAQADGVILVTPEYNGGYPAAVKNVVDLLLQEWKKKPVAISTVSGGAFGGSQVIVSLLFSLWKLGAWVIPGSYAVPSVTLNYSESGELIANKERTEARALNFVKELIWHIEAKQKMQ